MFLGSDAASELARRMEVNAMDLLNKIFYMVLMMGTVMSTPGGGGQQERRACPLVVEVKAANVQRSTNGINVDVQITNNSDSDFALSTTAKSPLFTLRVVNNQGVDLNKDQFRGWSKDRTNKATAPLLFKPHQTISNPATLTNYLDEAGNQKKIPAGQYQISALVPVVTNEGGTSRVELLESKPVTVTLK